MTNIEFDLEYAYSGDEIVVAVSLPSAPDAPPFEMLLDTGSSFSTLHHDLLPLLGIDDLGAGTAATIVVAGGQLERCWIHAVEIELLGRRMTIQAAFCPAWDMMNLLGMHGFMDQLTFAVDHRAHRLYLKWQA